MPTPLFRPREPGPGSGPYELFDQILDRVQRDLPAAVGLAVSVHGKRRESPEFLAARGSGRAFVEAQLGGMGGPVADALEYQVPVLSPDLWADDRWPGLTADSVTSAARVCGAAAVPGVWQADETVVLCAVLDAPASADTVITLIGYEGLITAAMVTAAARDSAQIADMLAVLQSRGAIEQAKGVIMGMLRCDADTAWATLRQASHESNVKLRVLSVALVEHIGGIPAEQPAAGALIVPDEPARRAAGLLWAVLAHAPGQSPRD